MQENHRRPPGLTPRAEKALRRTAVSAVFVIASAAAILSFNGLRNLALSADIPPELAWIFPIVVDGMTLVGSMGVVHAVLTGLRSWYPWLLTLAGVGMSVWGNVASSPPTLTAQIVHAIPPIVLALSLEALLKVYRYRAIAGSLAETTPTQEGVDSLIEQIQHAPLPGEEPAWVRPAIHEAQNSTGQDAPAVTAPLGMLATGDAGSKTTREQLIDLLAEDPEISAAEAARRLGKDRSNVSKILRELRPA